MKIRKIVQISFIGLSALMAGCHHRVDEPSFADLRASEQVTQLWYDKCFKSDELDSVDPTEKRALCQRVQSASNFHAADDRGKAASATYSGLIKR